MDEDEEKQELRAIVTLICSEREIVIRQAHLQQHHESRDAIVNFKDKRVHGEGGIIVKNIDA
jgi:hypothetical protein